MEGDKATVGSFQLDQGQERPLGTNESLRSGQVGGLEWLMCNRRTVSTEDKVRKQKVGCFGQHRKSYFRAEEIFPGQAICATYQRRLVDNQGLDMPLFRVKGSNISTFEYNLEVHHL